MNCGMKDDMLMAWVDGDLDQAGRARVAEHIVGCVDCHRTIGDLKDVTGALGKWGAPEPEALPTARELLDRVGLPPSSAAPGSGGWRDLVRRYGAVAGIALFAAVAGLVILPRYVPSEKGGLKAPVVGESATATSAPRAADGTTPPSTNPASNSAGDAPTGDSQEVATDKSADEQTAPEKSGIVGQTEADANVTDVTTGDSAGQGGEAAAAAEQPAPAPPPAAGPGDLARQPASEPAETIVAPGRDDDAGGKADSKIAAGRAAPAAPKPAARSAGRRESESAVVHRAEVSITGTEAAGIADRVAAAARAENGSVTKRWTRSKDSDGDTVTVELSVPAENFERTISRLRGVGNVQSVRRSAIDLSGRLAEINDEMAEERKNEDAPADTRKAKKSSKESLERERRSLASRAERAIITVTIVGRP